MSAMIVNPECPECDYSVGRTTTKCPRCGFEPERDMGAAIRSQRTTDGCNLANNQ